MFCKYSKVPNKLLLLSFRVSSNPTFPTPNAYYDPHLPSTYQFWTTFFAMRVSENDILRFIRIKELQLFQNICRIRYRRSQFVFYEKLFQPPEPEIGVSIPFYESRYLNDWISSTTGSTQKLGNYWKLRNRLQQSCLNNPSAIASTLSPVMSEVIMPDTNISSFCLINRIFSLVTNDLRCLPQFHK